MTHQMNIDMDKVKQGVADLKAHPPTEQEVAADPKAFLASHGVQITDDMNARITSALGARAAGAQQSAIIHIDG